MPGKTRDGERRETIEELSSMISIAQEMARRLADETHGDAYAAVKELNDTLHRAHAQLEQVKAVSAETH